MKKKKIMNIFVCLLFIGASYCNSTNITIVDNSKCITSKSQDSTNILKDEFYQKTLYPSGEYYLFENLLGMNFELVVIVALGQVLIMDMKQEIYLLQ
jgi:hypothetical protein